MAALKPCRVCGKQVSSDATACPHCGAPKPVANGGNIGCIPAGCLTLVVVIGIIATMSSGGDEPSTTNAAALRATLNQPPTLTRYTWGAVNIRSGPSAAHDPVRQEKAKATLIVMPAEDGWHAVVSNRTAKDTTGWVHESVVHADRLSPAEKERVAIAARRAFAQQLERNYLDQAMDIKVSVHGANATTLRLEFVLFSRVWAHHFQQGEHWQTLRELGFKRVEMRDGYDYSVYWTL